MTQPVTDSRYAQLALLIACFFWAISFVATKMALDVVPPLIVVTLRLVISSFCFVLWFLIRKEQLDWGILKKPGHLLMLSLFGTGFHYSIQTIGIQYTTASNASLYAITAPVSITIIAAIFLGERITLLKSSGIVIALMGAIIVMGIDSVLSFELKDSRLLGDLLVFASIFMWALFTVFGKEMTRQFKAVHLTAVITVIGSLYMLPLAFIEASSLSFSFSSMTLRAWLAILFLGITCSFLATLLYVFALERTDSQKVGVYLYTIPPMTYFFAAFVLGEHIGFSLLLGSILVFVGVTLTERG